MNSVTKSSTPASATNTSRNLFEDVYRIGGVIRRRWRLIVAVNLLFLSLAVLYLVQTKTVYKATARLLVIHQGEHPINVGGQNPFGHIPLQQDSLSTHLQVIKSPLIVGQALEVVNQNQLPVDTVIKNLKVQLPAGGGKVVDLDYEADGEKEAQDLLDAVISTYDQFLKDNFQKDTRDVMSLIVRARNELSNELKELELAYLEFRKKNPALTGNSEGRNFFSRRLDQWDLAAGQSLARSVQLKTQLEVAKKLSRQGVGSSIITTALNQLSGAAGSSVEIPSEKIAANEQVAPSDIIEAKGSYAQLVDQLADVEHQRRLTERLIEHYQSQQTAAAQKRPVDDSQVIESFYADPEIARRAEMLENARSHHHDISRVARNASDPSVAYNKALVTKLENELAQLWNRRKGAIANKLRYQRADEAIGRSESDLLILRARETFLRERVEEARAEELATLREERSRLVRGGAAAADPAIPAIDKQIANLEAGIRERGPRKGRGQTEMLVESLERSLEGVDTMRAEIQKRIESDVNANHDIAISLLVDSNLRSNLERQRTLFDSVAAQLKQAQLVSDYGSVTAQTISPTRVKPIRPWAAGVVLIMLILGLGIGTGTALLVETFEARVRTVAELRAIINLPVITLVPQVSEKLLPGLSNCGLLCHESPRSLAAELYKSARTQLEILRRDRRAQILLVSSPNSGDGKTTTSSNLAICQAHAGRRTLLIDGDLRRPSMHSIYGLKRDRGLSQVLVHQNGLERVVQATEIPNLDVITCGPDVSNPAEVLSSPNFGRFLEEIRPIYDSIIIDAPPLLIVTDPWIISSVADAMILVVKVGEVRRQALEQTMEVLKTLGTPALGLVINGITRDQFGFDNRFNALYGYGYGYGYGSGYGYGYGSCQDNSSPTHLESGKASLVSSPTHLESGKVSLVDAGVGKHGDQQGSLGET